MFECSGRDTTDGGTRWNRRRSWRNCAKRPNWTHRYTWTGRSRSVRKRSVYKTILTTLSNGIALKASDGFTITIIMLINRPRNKTLPEYRTKAFGPRNLAITLVRSYNYVKLFTIIFPVIQTSLAHFKRFKSTLCRFNYLTSNAFNVVGKDVRAKSICNNTTV